MVSVNNFISFLTLNGFFIGLAFAVLKITDPLYIVFAVVFITALFYMISIAAASFFIKNIEFKPRYRIKKEKYETAIDAAIIELEKRERLIKDMYEFIKELEDEEYEDMRRDTAQVIQAAKKALLMAQKRGVESYGENIKFTQDDLAVKFLPAVKALAFKLKERLPSSVEVADLISIGTEELVKLARKYDETQNDSFWGYARKRVYGAMLDYLRSLDTVSRADRKLIKDVDKIVSKYFGETGEEPSDEFISKELGVELSKVREARSSIGVFNVMPLGEQLQIYKDSDTLEGLEGEELMKRVKMALECFPEREQTVIQLYYFEELKLEEISEILGITTSRISQIHRHVLTKIREALGN